MSQRNGKHEAGCQFADPPVPIQALSDDASNVTCRFRLDNVKRIVGVPLSQQSRRAGITIASAGRGAEVVG
jgi:hypothetical protein